MEITSQFMQQCAAEEGGLKECVHGVAQIARETELP